MSGIVSSEIKLRKIFGDDLDEAHQTIEWLARHSYISRAEAQEAILEMGKLGVPASALRLRAEMALSLRNSGLTFRAACRLMATASAMFGDAATMAPSYTRAVLNEGLAQ